jgi:hypothetical protein
MVLRSLKDDMNYKPLTSRQRALAVELKEALDSIDDTNDSSPSMTEEATRILQGPFHALCVALFCRMNYEDERSEYGMVECPVYRFLVFASLRASEHGGGFEPAWSMTPICARLKFSIRLVVYHEILQRMLRDHQQQQEEDVPVVADYLLEARIEEREQLLKFVHADKYTPFAAIHNISLLASSVAGSGGLTGMPLILWTPQMEYTSLSIGGTLVTLDGLRELSQNLLDKAKSFLATEVLLDQRLEEMDELVLQQQHFVDDHRNGDPGYTFLNDPKNKLQKYNRCLLQALLTSPSTVHQFIANVRKVIEDGDDVEYNKNACLAWIAKTSKFLDILTTLIHISGGQPARAEELATLLICNTQHTTRGVYYMHNTIMLCTRYHKGRSIKGSNRVIPRFLPKSVADLLLQYLVIVRPLEV